MLALYDVPAPAKLNLFLHVVGKRPDGYHLLESVFTLVDWQDTLHFERRTDGRLQRHDLGEPLPENDLCLRAARLLQSHTGCTFGADIHIDKQLPSGAGMGGGSSDAASTLLALNRLWDLKLPRKELLALGLKLGADVPFFLGGEAAFVQGIGEILSPITLPEQRFAIIKPPVSIPTVEIFSSPLLQRSESLAIVAVFPDQRSNSFASGSSSDANIAQNTEAKEKNAQRVDLNSENCAKISVSLQNANNDLQRAAEQSSSQVTQALLLLKQKFGNSQMTGSGSAVFARLSKEMGEERQSTATSLEGLPQGWIGKICHSLQRHPLREWALD